MKIFAFLLLVGVASASFYDALDSVSDELVSDFLVGMENAPSLSSVLGHSDAVDETEDEIKTELGKTLKESLDHVLQRIRDAVDHGKEVSQELAEKAKEIAQKLKDLGLDAGSKAKELIERIKSKAKDWLKSILEKIGFSKRSLSDFIGSLLAQFNIDSLLQKLKEKIAEKVDIPTIVEYINKLFGKEAAIGELLLELIKTRGVEAIKNLIRKILPGGANYSIISSWESIKEFFKGLGVQVTEKFAKFSEWLKTAIKSGIENAKDRASQLKVIAKEVIAHGKDMSKEAAREALELLRPYKEDLGAVWDQLKEAVRNAIGTSD